MHHFPRTRILLPARLHRRRSQFNVLQPATGLKIDVIVASDSAFDRGGLSRRRRVSAQHGYESWFASPEELILKKLQYFEEGGSETHIRDILGVLRIRGD